MAASMGDFLHPSDKTWLTSRFEYLFVAVHKMDVSACNKELLGSYYTFRDSWKDNLKENKPVPSLPAH